MISKPNLHRWGVCDFCTASVCADKTCSEYGIHHPELPSIRNALRQIEERVQGTPFNLRNDVLGIIRLAGITPPEYESAIPHPLQGRSCRHGINPDECEFCDGPGADKEEATRQAIKRRGW